MKFILAQICGILILIFNVIAMQIDDKKKIILMFVFANLFSSLNFLLLNSYTGAIICFFAIFQTLINNTFDKKNKNVPLYLVITYIIIFIILGIITYQTIIDVLPIICSILYTLSIIQKREKYIRLISLFNFVLWVIYDFVCMAYTTGISDIIITISTLIGIYRFDITKDKLAK